MSNEKYEPIKFNSWQELAKYVIDGGEVYIKNNAGSYAKLEFDGICFNYHLNSWIEDTYTKKQPTLEELIAIKPRLCWVWDGLADSFNLIKKVRVINYCGKEDRYYSGENIWWQHAQILTDDEIKQFLDKEPS